MTDFDVMKPFNTVNRRLAPGDGPAGKFAAGDDPSPFTIEERVANGFLRAKAEPAIASMAQTAAEDPPAPKPPARKDAGGEK